MHIKRIFLLLSVISALAISGRNSYSQTYYSYVDEEGNRVFTNIPPAAPVSDLKITGEAPAPAPENPLPKSKPFDAIIEKYASDYSLDPSLVRSIIATESGFNPRAVSAKGARGLMQLMPATAERLGVSNSFDPEQNIHGGIKHFRSLLDNFNNNLELSLAAYNAGENLVQRLGRVPDIKETRNYVKSVTKLFGQNKLEVQTNKNEQHQQMYRYIDESGVLTLTNIPPLH